MQFGSVRTYFHDFPPFSSIRTLFYINYRFIERRDFWCFIFISFTFVWHVLAAILCAIKLRKRLLLPGVYGFYSCVMLSANLFLFFNWFRCCWICTLCFYFGPIMSRLPCSINEHCAHTPIKGAFSPHSHPSGHRRTGLNEVLLH